VDRYLRPSLALYRRLVDSGWDVNILGPDQQNALFSAVVFRDLESTRFLLRRGSKVTDYTLELAPMSENVDILRLVLRASHVKLSGERGQEFLGKPHTVARQICFNSYWTRELTSTRTIRLGHP